jgi:ABC-type transport system involved in multi-copper enzyme maturation permease subunit
MSISVLRTPRNLWLVARTIFIEALRRKEIYVIVLLTIALLLSAAGLRFFHLQSLHKFYQELALKTMSVATALTVIVLAARQLPREFERRTIYTLLAKPVARWEFLLGKYAGVVLSGWFCLGLFMAVYGVGRLLAPAPFHLPLFMQYLYLQALLVLVLAALSFLLSLLLAVDAAITVAMLLFLLGQIVTNAFTVLYPYLGGAGQWLLRILNYVIPQPALFDLSSKIVHEWPPLSAATLLLASLYALMFIVPHLALSFVLFRRRAL